jgi:hypothetical protein
LHIKPTKANVLSQFDNQTEEEDVMRDAVIVEAVRTPVGRGKPGGSLSGVHPVDLLAHSLRTLVERTGVDPADIDDVNSGTVSQVAEQAQNLTRSAVLAAGFPEAVPATTIDRQAAVSRPCTSPPRACSPAPTTWSWRAGSNR